ncbi:hypothetical protein RIF29_40313 [Crotalaria pallida]|uniref:Uncharacterized protein n=1 Tax=Crotalaria pallida TaxID=3830 RepID=A0AAN9E986_CROPI
MGYLYSNISYGLEEKEPLQKKKKSSSMALEGNKRRKIDEPLSHGIQVSSNTKKDIAIRPTAEAQKDGCTGNYRLFDSPFGNFLVPVVPTRAELSKTDGVREGPKEATHGPKENQVTHGPKPLQVYMKKGRKWKSKGMLNEASTVH